MMKCSGHLEQERKDDLEETTQTGMDQRITPLLDNLMMIMVITIIIVIVFVCICVTAVRSYETGQPHHKRQLHG